MPRGTLIVYGFKYSIDIIVLIYGHSSRIPERLVQAGDAVRASRSTPLKASVHSLRLSKRKPSTLIHERSQEGYDLSRDSAWTSFFATTRARLALNTLSKKLAENQQKKWNIFHHYPYLSKDSSALEEQDTCKLSGNVHESLYWPPCIEFSQDKRGNVCEISIRS